MPFVYSPRYYADIGVHVFPMIKYRKVYEKLLETGTATERDFVEPRPATDEELLLVHTPEYLHDLRNCAWTERTAFSELPLSREIVELFVLAAGGTIVSGQEALRVGWAVHLGGGFHHAFADKAEGFCYINDLAVAARALQQQRTVKKVAILDCDLHQGNGTARLFQGDETVYTFSIHQRDLYPVKERSDWDIHLPNGVTDEAYLAYLHEAIPRILDDFQPDLVLYQAGADPYEYDQLGSLALTMAGLKTRDAFVFEQCRPRGIPVAATLGGGYAYHTEDTVQIHFNTCVAALETFERKRVRE